VWGWLAIAGVSLRRIKELFGHKSIVTTERTAISAVAACGATTRIWQKLWRMVL
jgi:hypothetical protein